MRKEMPNALGRSDLKRLQEFPIFESLSAEEVRQILSRGQRRVYCRGEFICMENEPGDDFFLALDGNIKICLVSQDGKEIIVSTRGAGEFFGEMAIIEGKTRSATVVALSDTAVLSFGKNEFLHLIRRHPSIAFKLLQSLCSQLREADSKIRTLALLDVYGRVARTLSDMAKREGAVQGNGMLMFRRPTQDNIAKMVGASRETVSRTLKEMQRQGFFHARGKNIFISPASLEVD
jgi:CRP/FNR family transcriptional regulator/CRP/FNR family cyclic AMP-dependent transcriptional regulator